MGDTDDSGTSQPHSGSDECTDAVTKKRRNLDDSEKFVNVAAKKTKTMFDHFDLMYVASSTTSHHGGEVKVRTPELLDARKSLRTMKLDSVKCPGCGKSFLTKQALRNHQNFCKMYLHYIIPEVGKIQKKNAASAAILERFIVKNPPGATQRSSPTEKCDSSNIKL